MNRPLPTRSLRPALAYSFGNILNGAGMLFLLPTLLHVSEDAGRLLAKGLLVAQFAALVANYSFPIVTPRTLKSSSSVGEQRLLRAILIYQLTIGIVGSLAITSVSTHNANDSAFAFAGYLIGFTVVLQWQWYHIGRPTEFLQVALQITSRVALLIFEAGYFFEAFSAPPLFAALIVTLLMVTPIAPTLATVITALFARTNEGQFTTRLTSLVWNEIKVGKDLFFAGLLSAIYSLGPSTLAAIITPEHLVFIQQFDRLRNSLSNLTGMVLNSLYPLFLNFDHQALAQRFKITERQIILPAAVFCISLITVSYYHFSDRIGVLMSMRLNLISVALAFAAAIAGSASGVIAMTFLHPMNNDRRYRWVIFLGAFLFVSLTTLGLYIQVSSVSAIVMRAVADAEVSIMLGLWLIARKQRLKLVSSSTLS